MATKSDAVALPGARAVARHVRISPMKARRVVDLVRGLPAKEALTVLQFAPQAASEQVYKVLASAVANAENNERLDPDSLLVRAAYVDEGPTLKRFRPRAQGRAYRIRKRTCHITIEVESVVRGAARRRPSSSAPQAAASRPRGARAANADAATDERPTRTRRRAEARRRGPDAKRSGRRPRPADRTKRSREARPPPRRAGARPAEKPRRRRRTAKKAQPAEDGRRAAEEETE